jgi:hypothetical protein
VSCLNSSHPAATSSMARITPLPPSPPMNRMASRTSSMIWSQVGAWRSWRSQRSPGASAWSSAGMQAHAIR